MVNALAIVQDSRALQTAQRPRQLPILLQVLHSRTRHFSTAAPWTHRTLTWLLVAVATAYLVVQEPRFLQDLGIKACLPLGPSRQLQWRARLGVFKARGDPLLEEIQVHYSALIKVSLLVLMLLQVLTFLPLREARISRNSLINSQTVLSRK